MTSRNDKPPGKSVFWRRLSRVPGVIWDIYRKPFLAIVGTLASLGLTHYVVTASGLGWINFLKCFVAICAIGLMGLCVVAAALAVVAFCAIVVIGELRDIWEKTKDD